MMRNHLQGQQITWARIKDVPVRKPGAVPPKTPTIQKFKNGGAPVKPRGKLKQIREIIISLRDGQKPKHYDNPMIVDSENFKSLQNTEQMILVHTPQIEIRNKIKYLGFNS